MADARDPRSTITPDAFTVAPHLLGLPLARPSRRAVAMLVDLTLVAIMIKAIGFTFFALAAALLLFRVAKPSPKGGVLRRGVAWTLRVWAVVLLGIFGIVATNRVLNFIRAPRVTVDMGESGAPADSVAFSISDLRAVPFLAGLDSADEATARKSAVGIATWIAQRSSDPVERAATARWVLSEFGEMRFAHLLEQELDPLLGAASAPVIARDPAALRGYLDAVERGDTVRADSLLRHAQNAIAGDRIDRLETSRTMLQAKTAALEKELEHEREARGMRRFIAGLGDDLGVGFGWMAVYFTAFVVLWNGQTPGKRLLGVRIIRLDGKQLSWWLAFERFGGYAASLSTGLLGFLQILWDRNRQGMHDKFIETVVIRVTAGPAVAVPPPARSAPPPPPSAQPGNHPPA